ncbi:MAG: hypothetical protein Q9165_002569 [Trypethelium subeluteriae]
MATVFSAIILPHGRLWKKNRNKDPNHSTSDLRKPHHVAIEADEDDIKELNLYLRTLVEIFPDIQPAVFREMLIHLGPESRLEVVTEHLLKEKARWVKGRIRVSAQPTVEAKAVKLGEPKVLDCEIALPHEETFRSTLYKSAVRHSLAQEFKSLSRSSADAVLAECNYSYFRSRATLVEIASRSWRYSTLNFFTGRKASLIDEIPLITSNSKRDGAQQNPELQSTASPELNEEIYKGVIAPVKEQRRQEFEAKDMQYAKELNQIQAEEEGALYECQCCYTSTTFESLAVCNSDGHEICSRCIRRAVNQALFGQNWTTAISPERHTLRCIASTSGECRGSIDAEYVRKALLEDANGEEIWRSLEDRATSQSLTESQISLIKCPFCIYGEEDQIAHIKPISTPSVYSQQVSTVCVYAVLYLWQPVSRMLTLSFVCVLIWITYDPLRTFFDSITATRLAIARRRRGFKFICRNSRCGASSCIECQARWKDPHKCFENETTSLRTVIERAKADAVKRTCPVCHTSFVKDSGCNKMRCVCGYTMCYVCRQHITAKDGYNHFCTHFQAVPGASCTACDRCHLYKAEDEETAVKKAAIKAEKEWRENAGAIGKKVDAGDKSKSWLGLETSLNALAEALS